MKIAYLIEDFSVKGGAERIIAEKANALCAMYGHEVTIISVYADERRQSYPLQEGVRLVQLGVPFASRSSNPLKRTVSRIATLIRTIRRFNRTIKEIKPDAVFFTMILGALILPFARNCGRRVYESHLARRFTLYNRLFWLMERRADLVVCLTEDDAREYGRARRVEVIPNFIHFPEKKATDYSLKKCIAVGRLEHQKGFDMLIRIWEKVIRQHPGWVLHIYGEGSEEDNLRRQISEASLSGSITLCGRVDNLTELYSEYSIHLMPSHYEGMPMTLIEAQAAALPSVAFNFKYGASYIIKDGKSGIVVPEGDIEAFSDALSSLVDNCPMREKMGREAQKNSLRFDKINIMKRWEALIRGL